MRLAPLLLTALAAAAGACRDTPHDAPRDPAAGPRTLSTPGAEGGAPDASAQLTRRITPAPEHPRWIRGGSERDTILSFPRTLAVDDRHLYVLDADTHALLALRLADGALDWRVGGPRDSTIAPVALTAEGEQSFRSQELIHSCKKMLTPGREVSSDGVSCHCRTKPAVAHAGGLRPALLHRAACDGRRFRGTHWRLCELPWLVGVL